MSVEVSERWSDEKLHKDFNSTQWTGVRAFDVAGATSADAAAIANGSPYGAIPRIGQQHPRSSSMAVRNVDPERTGFNLYKVTVNYAVGTFDGQEDPLLQKPKLKWNIGSESSQVDHDADGNPIFNSAFDAFDPPPSAEFTTIFLTITRNEPYFDVTKAITYSNRINSAAFTIKGAGVVDAGQILCRSIQPTQEYIEGARFVPVAYDFELRSGGNKDTDGLWDGFKHRILDQGLRAYYDPTHKTRIYDPGQNTSAGKTPISSDVRLNGSGAVYEPDYFLYANGSVQPGVSIAKSPTGSCIERTDSAAFMKYKRAKTIDFAGLSL